MHQQRGQDRGSWIRLILDINPIVDKISVKKDEEGAIRSRSQDLESGIAVTFGLQRYSSSATASKHTKEQRAK
jgi:hypothetical protein